MKKILSSILVFTMAAALLAGCGGNGSQSAGTSEKGKEPAAETKAPETNPESQGQTFKFKLAENQPKDNPISQAMLKFADLVKEKTGGTVEIEVYLDAQLGNETETIDQVHAGSLDFARVNTSALTATVQDVGVFSLPYIFLSPEHKYKVLDGEIGTEILKSFEEHNMIGLNYWEAGSRNFYTVKKPVEKVADLKGLKIRVQPNDIAIKMVEALGGAATPMAYGEVYQGLQTGVIDAAENDFVSYYTSGHYEVAKYMCLDGHMAPPAVVIMSKQSWDKLSSEQQQAIREASQEACTWQRKAMDDYQLESRKKVEEAGCKINEVDVAEFAKAVQPVYDLYPQYAELISKIQNTK